MGRAAADDEAASRPSLGYFSAGNGLDKMDKIAKRGMQRKCGLPIFRAELYFFGRRKRK
jgi:hypothetical protein